MQNVVWIIQYKLKKGVTDQELIAASKRCCDEVVSKQKGYISGKQFRDGDTWVDYIEWETREDADNALTAGAGNPAAEEFYAKLNMNSVRHQTLSVTQIF